MSSSIALPPELFHLSAHLASLFPSLSATALVPFLKSRFLPSHWHPHSPSVGSGYRCIAWDPARFPSYIDPVIREATRLAGVTGKGDVRKLLGEEGWMVWCDPGCVSMREHGRGEVNELWGRLPAHLEYLTHASTARTTILRPRPSISAFETPAKPSITHTAPLPNRAIPILAPTTVVRNAGVNVIGVTPPTPIPAGGLASTDDNKVEGELVGDELARPDHHEGEQADDDKDFPPLRPLIFDASPTHSSTHSSSVPARSSSTSPNSSPTSVISGTFLVRPSSRASASSADSDHSRSSSLFSLGSASTAGTSHPPASTGWPVTKAENNVLRTVSVGNTWRKHRSTPTLSFGQLVQALPPSPSAPSISAPIPFRPARERVTSTSGGYYPHHGHAHTSSQGSNHGHGTVVLKQGPGTVTDYSGGKVGVMGGGVLLGLPKAAGASALTLTSETADEGERAKRRGGRRGRGAAGRVTIGGIARMGHGANENGGSVGNVESVSSTGGSVGSWEKFAAAVSAAAAVVAAKA